MNKHMALSGLSDSEPAPSEHSFAVSDALDEHNAPPIDAHVRETLDSHFWTLRFPETLEQQYRASHHVRAITSFHYRAPIILLLYAILISGIIDLLPAGSYMRWLDIYGWVGVVVIVAWILSYIPAFDRWFDWYVTLGSLISTGLSITVTNVIALSSSTILTHAGIMYAMIIIYSFVGLRFPLATFAGWAGGLYGFWLTRHLGGEMDWQLLHRTYTGTSILGMCLAYALDRQERKNFLQACLLRQSLSDVERLAATLDSLSRQDALTGLANRRHLDEVMSHEWSRAMRQQQSLTMMLIDVDFFKTYNDRLGHQAGDVCLQQIAQVLGSLAQRSGELAARYGGEEFVLLFPGMEEEEAETQAERLMARMAELALPHPDHQQRWVTFSIGIAVTVPNMPMTIEQFIRQADAALYKAKANGRNRYEFFNDTSNDPPPTQDEDDVYERAG